jgi:hypothetical protein
VRYHGHLDRSHFHRVRVVHPLAQIQHPNSQLRGITPWLVLLGAFAYALLVFVLQIFVDMEELVDLRLGFVLPWNYRWMIPGPS